MLAAGVMQTQIINGEVSSWTALLYAWSCRALSTDGTKIVVNA